MDTKSNGSRLSAQIQSAEIYGALGPFHFESVFFIRSMSGPKVQQFMGFGSVTGNLARVRISLFQIPDSNPEVQEVTLFTKNVHKIAKITSFE